MMTISLAITWGGGISPLILSGVNILSSIVFQPQSLLSFPPLPRDTPHFP